MEAWRRPARYLARAVVASLASGRYAWAGCGAAGAGLLAGVGGEQVAEREVVGARDDAAADGCERDRRDPGDR